MEFWPQTSFALLIRQFVLLTLIARVCYCQVPNDIVPPVIGVEDDPFNPPKLTAEEEKFYDLLKPIANKYRFPENNRKAGIDIDFLEIDSRANVTTVKKRMLQLSDLKALPKLSNVKSLSFSSELAVTDEWLFEIAKFKSLESLGLGGSEKPEYRKFTSEGFKVLADLPLRSASLHGCNGLDDEAMKTVADWEELRFLWLSGVQITDKGIYTIRGCRKLERLDISGDLEAPNAITNASIETLKGFEQLEELNISGTRIDETGRESLGRALPKCEIIW